MITGLDRYLVALPRGERRVFLSWRLLPSDQPDTAFHVERRHGKQWQQTTVEPIVDSTNFLDQTPEAAEFEYRIVTLDGMPSQSVKVDSGGSATMLAVDAPLMAPIKGWGKLALGDLDNDGRIDYVVSSIEDEEFRLYAYRHDGKPMWRFATGLPELAGGIPFLCWDVNGDGRTEVVVRNGNQGWAGELAMLRRGETPVKFDSRTTPTRPGETLVALDGETGEVVWEAPFFAEKLNIVMTVGHLRGMDQPPAVVVENGTYRDVWLHAFDGTTGDTLWRKFQTRAAGHNLDIGDIDGDGIQEVIAGGICYNGDGTVRWEAEPFGHTDISKPAKIEPNREGLQVWYAVENNNPGVYFVDKDGKTIFKEPFRHAHYGWLARHTGEVPGLQPHTAEDARHEYGGAQAGMRVKEHFPIFLPDGSHWLNLTDWQRKNFVPVHWDEGPEVVFIIRKENKRIVRLKENGEAVDLPDGWLPQGGVYGRNLACADVIGDFRENVVTLDTERNHLMVLVNPTVAHTRGYSPYDDFAYRHDRSQHGSGYYIYLSPPDMTVAPRKSRSQEG